MLSQDDGRPMVEGQGDGGLRWPPTSDDLNAVEVLVLDTVTRPAAAQTRDHSQIPLHLPARGGVLAGPPAKAAIGLFDILDLDEDEGDAFAAEGALDSSGTRSSHPRGPGTRPYAWATAVAVLTAAAVYVSVWGLPGVVSSEPPTVVAWSTTATAALPGTAGGIASSNVSERVTSRPDAQAAVAVPTQPADGDVRPLTTPPATVVSPTEPAALDAGAVASVRPTTRDEAADTSIGSSRTEDTPAGMISRARTDARLEQGERIAAEARITGHEHEPPRLGIDAPPQRLPASGLAGALSVPGIPAAAVLPPAPVLAVTPPAPAAPPRSPAVGDHERIQGVLRRYETAYAQLDARAAQAVWPGVDVRALARAFEGLESQTVRLGNCQVDVIDAVANAECVGSTTYVPRVGSRSPRTELRSWTFRLRRVDAQWEIVAAQIR